MKFLLGTYNTGKIKEIASLLGNDFELVSCSDFPNLKDVEETGLTLEENAILKAKSYASITGLNTIADDTGLEVEALNGDPGVYSARYAGEPSDNIKNIQKLLENLKGETNLNARFRTVIAVILNQNLHLFEGILNGIITFEPKGTNGFGYDSIFIPNNSNLTLAEHNSGDKNKISHRGIALTKMITFLKNEK